MTYRDTAYFKKAKIGENIIVVPKCEIIIVLSNYQYFLCCDSIPGNFSIAPDKVITLNLLCFIIGIILMLLFFPFYSYCSCNYFNINSCRSFLLLKTKLISFVYFLLLHLRLRKGDNYYGSNTEKRNYESVYKTDKTNEENR